MDVFIPNFCRQRRETSGPKHLHYLGLFFILKVGAKLGNHLLSTHFFFCHNIKLKKKTHLDFSLLLSQNAVFTFPNTLETSLKDLGALILPHETQILRRSLHLQYPVSCKMRKPDLISGIPSRSANLMVFIAIVPE